MVTDSDFKEVRFDIYCPACKYRDNIDPFLKPCDECLDEPTNLYSHRPIKWERGMMTVDQAYDILHSYSEGKNVTIYDKGIINIVGEEIFKALKDKGYLEKCGTMFGMDEYMLVEREDN